jgi:hypothetical protein
VSKGNRCRHGLAICEQCLVVTDDARRMADAVNGMLSFHQPWELRMKFAAVNLQDGSVRSEIYDSIEEARKDTANSPSEHAYMAYRNYLGGLSREHAQIFLSVHRIMPRNVRQGDPDNGKSELIMSTETGDAMLNAQRWGILKRMMAN